MFNLHIIVGRVGRDPEVSSTSSGLTIAKTSVATFRKFHDKAVKATKEETNWHNVVFFGNLAEICGRIVKKGSVVLIAGRHTDRKIEVEGETKAYSEIVANDLQVIQWPEKKEDSYDQEDIPF